MNNLYNIIFPQIYISSWSGGKDSTATIILAHIHNEPLDKIIMSEVMFDKKRNISGELPEHIEWIHNTAIPQFNQWGYKVEIIKSNKDYLDLFYSVCKKTKYPERIGKYQAFPIGGRCVINRDLKVKPIIDYCKNIQQSIVQYLGIAIDEPRRLEKLKGTNKISLLEKYQLTETQAFELCKQYNLLSPIYKINTRGGCWFCPNQRNEELAYLIKNHPELWNELKMLSKEENLISYGFRYGKTVEEVELKINKLICEGDANGKYI